ncbi:MAG: hypothetical protein ABSE68_00250 [Minisyncoccia bacterium]
MRSQTQKIFLTAGLFFAATFSVMGQTQNTQVIITWRANSYFPADYAGKASAAPGAALTASAELISAGKLQDIVNANINWSLNGNLIDGGTGLKTVSFTAAAQNQGYEILNVSINTSKGVLENSTRIPVSKPEVVLSFPYPQKSAKAGGQITVSAIPFFFNVLSFDDLKFDWRINNEKVTVDGNKITANIGTPQSDFQNSVQILATVQNSKNLLEFARGTLILPITQ